MYQDNCRILNFQSLAHVSQHLSECTGQVPLKLALIIIKLSVSLLLKSHARTNTQIHTLNTKLHKGGAVALTQCSVCRVNKWMECIVPIAACAKLYRSSCCCLPVLPITLVSAPCFRTPSYSLQSSLYFLSHLETVIMGSLTLGSYTKLQT